MCCAQKLLSDSREELRDAVAQLYGCVAGFSDEASQELAILASQLSMDSKDLETQHGHTLSVGYTVERAVVALGDAVNSQLYEAPLRAIGESKPIIIKGHTLFPKRTLG